MLKESGFRALVFGMAVLLSFAFIPAVHAADKVIIFRDDDAQGYWLVNILANVTTTLEKNGMSQTIGLIPYMSSSSSASLAYSAEVASPSSGIGVTSVSAREEAMAKRDAKLAELMSTKPGKGRRMGISSITPAATYISFGDDAELKSYLNSIKSKPSVEIALHGFIHSDNEFQSLTYSAAKSKIDQGKQDIYSEIGVSTVTFMPPYNTFNTNTLTACKDSGLTRFSAADYSDPDMWKENPSGLLHVPDTAEFYDWDNNKFRTASEITADCQADLDAYNVCVLLIHPEEFTTDYATVNSGRYSTLLSVIAWVKQKQAGGVKLMTIGQYGSSSCANECPSNGTKQCSGNGVQTCGNYDSDSCLEWSAVANCSSGQVCSNGTCIASCTNECSTSGAKQCYGTSGYQVCGNYDSDSCLEWSGVTNCALGQVCSNGNCIATCTNLCTGGAKQCSGTSGYQMCGDYNSDGCTEWSSVTNCTSGQICSGGSCIASCTDECSASGTKQCSGNGYQTCGNYDTDSCLEWSSVTSCQSGQTCTNGNCAASCTPNTCSSLGYTCGSASDGCNGTLNCGTCGTGYTCIANKCVATCTNQCTSGAKQCSGTSGYQTCGDYNSDGCTEWSAVTNCPTGQTCSNGACLNSTNVTTKTLQRKITAGKWDAYEKSGTTMYPSAYIAPTGKSGTTYYRAGFIFTNMTIPKGATIISAKLMLPYNWRSGSNANTILYGEASNNPAQFATTSGNITKRPKTTSSVAWNKLPSTTWGRFITSPDVSSIVREVIGRSGWASGNNIAILQYEAANATSEWEAVTYEGCGGGNCTAILEVKYSG